jgi:polyhydroxybutyrate depolymerase
MIGKCNILILFLAVTSSYFTVNAQYTQFEHEGINRQYIYYEPIELDEQKPLVFVMHGFTGDASGIKNYSGMNQIADQYGFAVCYPRGTTDSSGNRFWNVGYAFHEDETVNDVGFLTELATYLQINYDLNPDFTFATGMSNGGEMCYMLACQANDTFKAVAPVAGMILQDILDECQDSNPIPIFEIHGSEDNITPISGDPNNNDGWGAYPSIPFTINYFSEKNECSTLQTETLPDIDLSDGSYVVSEKHLNGINNNEVWYYEIIGGGHDWPGAWGNMDINAGEEAWLFFQKYIDDILSNTSYSFLNKNIHVFPNPTKGLIHVKSNDRFDILEITLVNVLGTTIEINLSNESIDLSDINTGIYFLSVKTSKGMITKKIMKF